MLLIKKNPNAIEQNGEVFKVFVPENIVIELDDFSALVYNSIEDVDTFDELLNIAMTNAVSCGIGMVNEEDMRNELQLFLVSIIAQGALICDEKVVAQPYYAEEDGENFNLYFPYLRMVYKVNPSLYESVKKVTIKSYDDIFNVKKIPESNVPFIETIAAPVSLNDYVDFHHIDSRRIVMLPTTACNLKCEYCYAWREEKMINNMTKCMAESGIDYVASNAIIDENPSIDVSFMGGGEPTCNWNIITHSVEYSKRIAQDNQLPFSSTLTTNGVINDEKIDWIINNIDFVKISFDGIEKIQNKQRPAKSGDSFSQVIHTMKRLSDAAANFLVRITVTNDSLEYLKESVEYIVNNFNPKSIIINPVYVCGSCASHGVSSIDYLNVCSLFNEIQNIGVDKHIDIVIPYDKITYMDVPKLPFCGFQKGNCFMTPEGYVSACSEIDGCDDQRATIFFFGAWDKDKNELVINEEKEKQLHAISTAINVRCMSCSNQSFCPGPCLVRRINPETLKKITKMRAGKHPTESFTDEEFELLYSSDHSPESIIQCNMTKILTDYQINRIANMSELLNELSLQCTTIDTKNLQIEGLIKAISIRCK